MHLRRAVIVALSLTTLVTAGPAAATAKAPSLWSRTDLIPVSPPASVAGRVVVYTERASQLYLTALDPANGHTVWSVPASYSATTVGVETEVAHAGNLVYYFSPAGSFASQQARLSAIDARTGAVRWQVSTVDQYTDSPDVCRVVHPVICVTSWSATAVGNSEAVRVNGSSGAETRLSGVGGRGIGPSGLIDTEVRPGEVMERINVVTGRVLWRLPLSRLSPHVPVSTDGGWNWDLSHGVYVGTDAAVDGSGFDLARQWSFGVRASDGKVLWRRPGFEECLIGTTAEATTPYLCTGTGSLNYTTRAVSHVDVTLNGIDPTTGRTTWTRRLGYVDGWLNGTASIVTIGPGKLAVPLHGGATVGVDLHNGRTVAVPPVSASAVSWCTQSASWPIPTPLYLAGRKISAYPRFGLVRPCLANGKTTAASTRMPVDVGAKVGAVFVWSEKDGLHAIRR